MAYYLVQQYGPREQPLFRKEPFATEPQAVCRAAEYFMAGSKDSFVVENAIGHVVTNDLEIRERCKITRMP